MQILIKRYAKIVRVIVVSVGSSSTGFKEIVNDRV